MLEIHQTCSFFPMVRQPQVGQGLLTVENIWSHSNTTKLVGLPWVSDVTNTGDSTWQNKTLTTDRHPCHGGILIHNPSKWATTEPRLRPHCHSDRLQVFIGRFLLSNYVNFSHLSNLNSYPCQRIWIYLVNEWNITFILIWNIFVTNRELTT